MVARGSRRDVRYMFVAHGEPAAVTAGIHADTLTVSTTEPRTRQLRIQIFGT